MQAHETPETSTPSRIGVYRPIRCLGEGGMGVVWLAEHEATGEQVALKTVRLPQEGLLQGLRREIHALTRLRHPGIVRVVDEGVHAGNPWYAMELVDGVPLGQWRPRPASRPASEARIPSTLLMDEQEILEQEIFDQEAFDQETFEPKAPEAPALPELADVLGMARRLCLALAYLHGEGVVHRDLKPDNILVRPGGRPVIVDFGLAWRTGALLGREALEVAGHIAGTIAYMAPEQGRGEAVDARADLYSLGCILYELVTGRPPFLGRLPMRVLLQHFEAAPEPPSRLRPGLPHELERLILRLLEKQPRARLGYADDVAAVLARLLGGADAGAAAREPDLPEARPYLYRPGYSGRQAVIDRLRGLLEGLRSKRGSIVMIGGESGSGKTRLLVELSRLGIRDGALVCTGECPPPVEAEDPASGSAPLQAFLKTLEALADRCREHGEAEARHLLGERGPVLAAYAAELGRVPGARADVVEELPAKAAGLRLFSYLAETLAALAGRAPVLLLLDDLQWADELSLGALEFLAKTEALAGLPIVMIGVYRAEEASAALLELARAVHSIRLERLDAEAVARITGDMLGLSVPPEGFSRFLLEQSEGNPFFVAEYLRSAIEAPADGGSPLLWRDAEGHWQVAEPGSERATARTYAELPLPRSLLELVSGRLARLSPATRRWVEALAVLGREADEAVLAGVSGLDEAEARGATREAMARQVLEAAEAEGLRFVHDKLREVAYAGLDATRRRELHRAAAETLELLRPERRETLLAALARHWEQGGEPARAMPCYLAAARRERDRYAWQEAEAHYRAYLRLAPEGLDGLAVRLEMGKKVLQAQGQNRQAIEELEAALAGARAAGAQSLEAEALAGLGGLYRTAADSELAQSALHQALDIWRSRGDLRGEAHALGSLGILRHKQGRVEEAQAQLERALELHRQLGDRRSEALVLGNLAILNAEQGRIEAARSLFERAIPISREAGDRRNEGVALGNLGNLLEEEGRTEAALPLYEQALAIHRQVGNRGSEGIVLGNLAILHWRRGRTEPAQALYGQAIELLRRVGNRRGEGNMLSNLAGLEQDLGHVERALQTYEQALEIHQKTGDYNEEASTLTACAMLLRRAFGRLEAAAGMASRAEALLLRTASPARLGVCLCELGHLALARGQSGQAALEAAERIDREVPAQNDLLRGLGRLRRAQAAFESGAAHRLVRGELPEDLPEGVRRWLAEKDGLEVTPTPRHPQSHAW